MKSSGPLKLSTLQTLIEENGNQSEEVSALCRAVIHLKESFEDKSEVDQDVLLGFATLASEIISSRGSSLNRSSMFLAWKAGKILMRYLLENMQVTVKNEEGGAGALKRCLGPFTSFCAGTGLLKRDECLTLLASIRKNVDKFPAGHIIDDEASVEGDDSASRYSSLFGELTETVNPSQAEQQNRPQTDLVIVISFVLYM
jgi:hypothetical protein